MMKPGTIALALVGILILGLGSAAFAQQGGLNDTNRLSDEMQKVGGFLLKVVFLGFLIVGCYIIITSLVDAKHKGGWGHFVVGLFMVLLAGVALWTITSMSNQDPNAISQGVKVQMK
jgi:uncharacterized membrane protein HdeD (DUF308 family)